MKPTWVISAALALVTCSVARGQTPNCKDMVYRNRNQIDYGRPITVAAAKGVAEDRQGVRIPKACVGIFTEPSHKLVAFVEAEGDGRFEVKGLAGGDYRLVVEYDGFC